ncbi:type I restriction enzyme HsdR N-terminal domain-containing protein [Candidatus Woesearchaeota archaeon]|nr:type I restriction enzyme HsdR N-terminal domain-containing protein [Candidatus Woesearchaeota archaeon]
MGEFESAKRQFDKYRERVDNQSNSEKEVKEKDTITKFIFPFLELLGWDSLTWDVEQDYKYVDVALKIGDKHKIFVEAKPFRHELHEGNIKQIVDYALKHRVRWCILTNGRQILAFDIKYKQKYGDLFFKIDFSLSTDEEFKILWLLSKTSVSTNRLDNVKEKFNKKIRKYKTPEKYITKNKIILNIIDNKKYLDGKSSWRKNELFEFLDETSPTQSIFLEILSSRKGDVKSGVLRKKMSSKLGEKNFKGNLTGALKAKTDKIKKEYLYNFYEKSNSYILENKYRDLIKEYFSRPPRQKKGERKNINGWSSDEIKNYLNLLKEWSHDSYAYYEVLLKSKKRLSRKELVDKMKIRTNNSHFISKSIAGILSGITRKTIQRGKERLDKVSDDNTFFEINKKYEKKLKKYFNLK